MLINIVVQEHVLAREFWLDDVPLSEAFVFNIEQEHVLTSVYVT